MGKQLKEQSQPEKPKKPLSKYFLFSKNLKDKHPNEKLSQQFIKEQYDKLSEKESAKLDKQIEKDLEKWKKDVMKWEEKYGKEEKQQKQQKQQIKKAKNSKKQESKNAEEMEEEEEEVQEEEEKIDDTKNKNKKAPKKSQANQETKNQNQPKTDKKESQCIGLGKEDPIWYSQYKIQDSFMIYQNYDVKLIGGKNDAYYYIAQIMINRDKSKLLDEQKPYLIWSRAGKIGFKGTQDNEYLDEKEVIKRFKAKFRKQTGISWDDRFTKDATGKYRIDFSNDLDMETLLNPQK